MDCPLGIYGDLHGMVKACGGLVWLDAFDRLAWYYSMIINLRSNIALDGGVLE